MQQYFEHKSPAASPTPAAARSSPAPLDEDWLLIAGIVLAFTQLGFGFLEAGSVRYKNQ